ncbi:mechanosensitive ion channel family protein [Thermodesulfobacteriota bacterium]
MKLITARKPWFMALMIFLFLSTAVFSFAQENKPATTSDLKEIVTLLEDPQKREVLVKNLKHMIQVQEAGQKEAARPPSALKRAREISFVASVFARFELFSEQVIESAGSTLSWIFRMPESLGGAKSYLGKPENRNALFKLLLSLILSVIIGAVIRFSLRKYRSGVAKGKKDLPRKVASGVAQVLLAIIPYAAAILSLFILFNLLPSFPAAHSLSFLFFTILLLYRAVLEISQVLLCPEDQCARLIPINDENANYLSVWIIRFARFTAFYQLFIGILPAAGISYQDYAFIRALLLLVFPCMISLFVMQLAREIRGRFGKALKMPGEEKIKERDTRKLLRPLLRYWTFLAIPYCWIIFGFLIVHYEMGFSFLFAATLWTALTIFALTIVFRVNDWAFKKFFAINEVVKERFPGLEERTNRYISILKKAVKAFLVIVALGIIANVWGIPVSSFVASKAGAIVILRALAIIITAGVVLGIIETSQYMSEYLMKEKKKGKKKGGSQKTKTLVPVINTAVKIAACFIGGIIILERLGVNTTPILAGAGIVGLAVGFGAQTLVKDIINGLFILFEESLRVGDYADLGKKAGIVEGIGLRTVKLRDVYGNVHVVPNSSIDAVTNMSKEFSRSVIDIGVAYREDLDEVIGILKEIGEEMRNDPEYQKNILEPMEVFGLQEFGDSAIIIRVRLTTKPLKQWGIKRAFNMRVKKKFDERGIEIPFPHRTIYMGEPKQGHAPAVNVRLSEDKAPVS